MSISLSQIQYVLALEKTGSFSEAAKQCHITQSTLSTMIRKLEKQIGMEFFDRKAKPVQLTSAGLEMIDQFKVINNEYENLLERIQETKDAFYGVLKIGIIPTLAPFLLPLFLDRLVKEYPKVNFNIHEITTDEIIKRLKLRELDIGLLSLPIRDRDLKQRRLFEEAFLVYDTRGTAKRKKKFKITEIDINRLWLLEESHCLSGQIEKICYLKKKRMSDGNLIFRSGSIHSLIELVKINKGLTLLPKLATLQENLISPDYIYQIAHPVPVREIGMVTHQNFAKTRLLNILEAEILNAVKPRLDILKKKKIIAPY